jgi:hypothetical protein
VKPWTTRVAAAIAGRPLLLFAALYAALGLLAVAAGLVLPETLRRAVGALTRGAGLGIATAGQLGQAAPPPAELWAIAVVAMASAGALALPVAWLYTVTRKKRGYRQSSVHSLILLAVVVAGVVVLVKFSLALAFSLAGIVAAVRFRHTLEDSKDAIYIFAVTGIGLAAGVELTVAATLSVVFNLATVLLFWSDFGRLPADLEGRMAEERMQRALAVANRTSQFVARLDREILQQMAPAQLEALADRALERRGEVESGTTGERRAPERVVAVLRVTTSGETRARETVESVLGQLAKSWRFRAAQTEAEGRQVLEYVVQLRKSVQPALLLDAVRRPDAGVHSAELA